MIELNSTSPRVVGFPRFKECFEAVLLKEEIRAIASGTRSRVTHRISQAVYSIWREENFLPDNDLRSISPDEIEAIYQGCFWIPSQAQECPRPVDLLVFDAAIQGGPKHAVALLQRVLGVPCDGIFGQVTRQAVLACDGCAIARRFQELDGEVARNRRPRNSPQQGGVEINRTVQRLKVAA